MAESEQTADQTQTQQTEKPTDQQRSLVNEGTTEPEKKVEQQPEQKKDESAAPSINLSEFKLPEGFKLDEAQGKAFTELLSRPDLSKQALAQELLNLYTAERKKDTDQLSSAWTATVDEWHKNIASDPEIGTGDTKAPLKPEVKATLAKVLDAYGGTELRQALDLTGAGSNPAIIRALVKMAPKLVETSRHVQGSPPSTAKPKGPSASALYPDLPEG